MANEQIQTPLFNDFEAARAYVDNVREHFREGDAQYRGQRTDEQQLIAEVVSEEAREIIDGTMAGLLAVMSAGSVEMPTGYAEGVEKAAYNWGDFRNHYQRLLVGFGILTNRLHRDGFDVPSYADMRKEDGMKVASVLLTDFLTHNALRFGVDSAGLIGVKHKTIHTEDGGVKRVAIYSDRDQAHSEREIETNMTERDYVSHISGIPATHVAGKMSPEQYKELRTQYSDIDKDLFDQLVGAYTNVEKELNTKYGS